MEERYKTVQYKMSIFISSLIVRSELKKDKRTIEEALADIHAKKQKREHGDEEPHLEDSEEESNDP